MNHKKIIIDITINFDISARLTHIIKRNILLKEKKVYKIREKLGQIHNKKRWQILSNQVQQNKTEEIHTYYEKKLI